MPAITRRQPSVDLRKTAASPRSSIGSSGSNDERYWISEESFQKDQDEKMDYPTAQLVTLPPKRKSKNNLRLTTAKPDLHDRYQSSEEEASPSPDDYTDSNDESLEQATEATMDFAADAEDFDNLPVTITVASAMPIVFAGRPRLIDIKILAPIQKRKRASPPVLASFDDKTPTQATYKPRRIDSLSAAAPQPQKWLPEDEENMTLSESEEAEQLLIPSDNFYFPTSSSSSSSSSIYKRDNGSPSPTSYAEYDPYMLDPPRLSRTDSDRSGIKGIGPERGWRKGLGLGLTRKGRDNRSRAKGKGRTAWGQSPSRAEDVSSIPALIFESTP